jgi:hypothetical protein
MEADVGVVRVEWRRITERRERGKIKCRKAPPPKGGSANAGVEAAARKGRK